MVDTSTSLETLFAQALKQLAEVHSGEVFRVRDLFCGLEWKRIDVGMRIRLGAKFFTYAKTEGAEVVIPLDKTAQNQQRYKKI